MKYGHLSAFAWLRVGLRRKYNHLLFDGLPAGPDYG